MMRVPSVTLSLTVATLLLPAFARPQSMPAPTIEQYLRPGVPYELVAAKKADRIAWIAYEAGARNVYTAAAP
ncbi:MAG: hypothetical protein EHM24_05690, partial [Acidobacteria bacterium]